jgi:hypothetical protein
MNVKFLIETKNKFKCIQFNIYWYLSDYKVDSLIAFKVLENY